MKLMMLAIVGLLFYIAMDVHLFVSGGEASTFTIRAFLCIGCIGFMLDVWSSLSASRRDPDISKIRIRP